jgi:hypothetical protein
MNLGESLFNYIRNLELQIYNFLLMEKKSLKILVATFGSRGDAQPMVGLTLALRQAGHDAVFQGPDNAKDLAEKAKVPFLKLKGDPEAILKAPETSEIFQTKDFGRFQQMKEWKESYGIIGEEILEACEGKDLLISVAGIFANCWLVHKKCGIPLVCVALQPFYQTKCFGYCVEDPDPFRSNEAENLESWKTGYKGAMDYYKPILDLYKTQWNITIPDSPLGIFEDVFQNKITFLHGFSKETVGGRPSDWPEQVDMSGYFDLVSEEK